jgi:hypothetical protein
MTWLYLVKNVSKMLFLDRSWAQGIIMLNAWIRIAALFFIHGRIPTSYWARGLMGLKPGLLTQLGRVLLDR